MNRNVEINATSPHEDLLAALTGIWSVTEENGWTKLVISSRLILWRRLLKAGKQQLPKKFNEVNVVKMFNSDGTVSCSIIRIGDEAVNAEKECFAEIIEINKEKEI